MIIVNNVNVSLDTDFSDVKKIAARALKINESEVLSARLHRKSVDARKKSDVHFCVSGSTPTAARCPNRSKATCLNSTNG